MAALPKAVGYRVWLGSQIAGYCGCGIIVDERHVVTCNHVVRQCLGRETFGGERDDLAGERVIVRYGPNELAECEVVRNVPLPEQDGGTRPADDLALLRRTDGRMFPPNSAAELVSAETLERLLQHDRAKFRGTGMGVIAGQLKLASQYSSIGFEGRLLIRAEFRHWYHTAEDLGHLITEKGCSGGAAVSVELPDTVLGLIQGGLKAQSGLIIPAPDVARFLAENGLHPRLHTEPVERRARPSAFARIRRKPVSLDLEPEFLADCDREMQRDAFGDASVNFLQTSGRSFFLAIAGCEKDLPDLSNRKLGRDSIMAYWDWMRVKRKEAAALRTVSQYPSILVRCDPANAPADEDGCIRLLARGTASDALLRNKLPDAQILIDAMDSIDSPIVVVLWCSAEAFSEELLGRWHACMGSLAAGRQLRPIVTILFVDCPGSAPIQIGARPGVSVLPALGLLNRSHVRNWANGLFSSDMEKTEAILSRVAKNSFALSELHEWLFGDAD